MASEALEGLVYEFDCLTDQVERSCGLTTLTGYHPDEAEPTGTWWRNLVHPEDLERIHPAFTESLKRNDSVFRCTYRIRHKQGHWVTVRDSARVLYRSDGEIRRMVGCTIDVSAQLQAEEALHESEAILRAYCENTTACMGIVELGQDDVFHVYDNPATCRFFGVPVGSSAGRWASEMGSPQEVIVEWARHYRESERTGEPVQFEFQHTWPGQKPAWLGVTVSKIPSKGSRSRFCYVAIDITRSKEAEEELRETMRRQDLLAETAGLLLRSESPRRLVNEICARVMHYLGCDIFINYLSDEHASVLRLNAQQGLLPAHIERFTELDFGQALCSCAARDGVLLHIENAMEAADPRTGFLKDLQIQAYACHPLVGEQGVVGTISFGARNRVRFSTEDLALMRAVADQVAIAIQRRLSEEKVSESEGRFRNMADDAPMMLWVTDASGDCTYRNRLWQEFTGQSPDESLGNGWLAAIHPEDRESCRERFAEARRSAKKLRMEYRLRRADGEYRWVLDAATPRRAENGMVFGYIGSVLDIHDRKLAEAALRASTEAAEAANRAKDNFLATLSHELRTPLTPVLMVSAAHERSTELSKEIKADFAMIRRNIALEARLIDDMLDLSRIVTGKVRLDFQCVDIHAILKEALRDVEPTIHSKMIRLALDLTSEPASVSADEVRLRQIIWNILKNAAKFTPSGGRITIRTRVAPSDHVIVEVHDTGIGITPQELATIFKPFSQGEHASSGASHSYGGLGLGLTITHMLVELHRGKIRAESTGRDQGATFVVELPLVPHGCGL